MSRSHSSRQKPKPTQKAMTASSEKIKKKVKALALKKSESKPEVSTKPLESPVQNQAVDPVLEGVVNLMHMTFEDQARLIFSPMSGISSKYMIAPRGDAGPTLSEQYGKS